jgi:copper(I)-binding protein
VIRVWIAAMVAGILSPVVAAQSDEALELKSAWVRALPPFQPNTAAYFTLVNRGEVAVAIVGASSDVAEKVEIHRTREVDGLMRMEQLDGLALAPGEEVELAPGGTHLMLLDLAYMPAPGDEVRLCVQLASGGEVCTVADVRKSADVQGHQHHN